MQHPVKEVRQTERKDMKKLFSRLTLALSVALVASIAIAGVAIADQDPPRALDPIGITKNLDMPAGTSTPGFTFAFTMTQGQPVGGDVPADLEGIGFEVMPNPTVQFGPDRTITFPAGYFGERQTDIRLNNAAGFNTQASFAAGEIDILFPHAGIFHIFLEEVHNTNAAAMAADAAANPNAPGTLTYSTAIYILTFEVRNVDGQLRVTNVIGQPGTPGTDGTLGTPGNPGSDDRWVGGPKLGQLIPGDEYDPGSPGEDGTPGTPGTIDDPSPLRFTNIFTRQINGDLDNPAFAVTKTVEDTSGLSDLSLAFSTVTTLTVPQQLIDQNNATTPPTPLLTLTGANAPVVVSGSPAVVVDPAPTVTVTGTGTPADPFVVEADLRHGERLVFPTLPAGTIFGSTEIQHRDYTGEGRVFVAGNQIGPAFGDVTNNNLQGERIIVPQAPGHFVSDISPFNNRIDFINDFVHSPPTGLVITSMPVLAALILATLTLAMMVASRSRKRVEQMPVAF
jgi:hypothetical protein